MIEGGSDDVGCGLKEGRFDGSNDTVGRALGRLVTVGMGVVEGAGEDVGVLVGCALVLGCEVNVGRGIVEGAGEFEGAVGTNVGATVIFPPAIGIVGRTGVDDLVGFCDVFIEGELGCPDVFVLLGWLNDGNDVVCDCGGLLDSCLEKIVGLVGNFTPNEGSGVGGFVCGMAVTSGSPEVLDGRVDDGERVGANFGGSVDMLCALISRDQNTPSSFKKFIESTAAISLDLPTRREFRL
jgi:hypothetical protein